ncbi:protein phosphatase 1 regulatory subunit 15A [Erinaceus europaeus]|uniref:Protein phosphatase 1 regulatory subunit 15A n=1 Tax=Erinaceus europaeus TaxID=9365 RepID=A0A1S3AJH2_ERIEU|nr:protein phosphatase 1 regulatory subunit 15A [Erinaceus europaeus]
MAPGQASQHSPLWRDVHSFFLLHPLMGLLSRTWSRLRGPDAGPGAGGGAAAASLAGHHAPWGRHLAGETGDRETTLKDEGIFWGTHLDLQANSSLEVWRVSDDDDDDGDSSWNNCGGEAEARGSREQGSGFLGGQPAPLSPSPLRRTFYEGPGEETSAGGMAEDKEAILQDAVPRGQEEEEGRKAVTEEASTTPACPFTPGSQPRARVSDPVEGEDGATEEESRRKRPEGTEGTATLPASPGCHPGAGKCCSGNMSSRENNRNTQKGEADPEPHSAFSLSRHLPSGESTVAEGAGEEAGCLCQPGEHMEESEDSDWGAAEEEEEEAEGLSPIPPKTFMRGWAYQPGEDAEATEEEEDGDWEAAEEPSLVPKTSAFLQAWVYRPGEDTEEEEEEEEESDWGASEGEGEAEGLSSAFLRAWVYRPRDDMEEDSEDEDHGHSAAATSGARTTLQTQSAPLRGWTAGGRGAEFEGREAAERRPFRVAIYLPGERPPPSCSPPRLPHRLQRRLKSAEPPSQLPDPGTPPQGRKVRFSEEVSVHILAVWAGPAQAARRGPWEQMARDRSRFARRIAQAQEELGPCLTPEARARAWARLTNLPAAQTLPSVQATASPSSSPCVDLSGRRG